MLNRGIIDRCRAELMRTARAGAAAFAEGASPSEVHRRGTITYARLAALVKLTRPLPYTDVTLHKSCLDNDAHHQPLTQRA